MAGTNERVAAALQGLAHEASVGKDGMCVVRVAAADAKECIRRLKERAGFETNTFVTGVDRFPKAPRYECHWQFMSVEHADRVRVCAALAGDEPKVASIVDLYPGAAYAERECFDMFGVNFKGHPDPRRILLYPEFQGHPLRKDYPANKIQPLVEFREGTMDRLPPFGLDEGMSFGRQTHLGMQRRDEEN